MIDQKTSHQAYPLPHADNALGFDVARVRDAVTAIDGDVFQATAVATAAKQLVDGVIANTVATAQAGKVLKLDANAALPASVTGNAATADKLKTARTVSLSGAASGSVAFDGSASVTIPVTVANDSHKHAFGNLTDKPSTLGGYGIQDAYTKTEIDNLVTGLDMKASVRLATTADLGALTGAKTVDGVAVANGDRVLVKDQAVASQNGIYIADTGAAWSRAGDANNGAKVTPGMYVFVEEGAVNDNSGWVLATNGAITVGSTALSFVQFNGLGQVTAGTGLQKSGNVIALANTAVAAGTYGSATQAVSFKVNGQGQLTEVTPVTITPDWNSITNRDAAPANHTHTLAIGDGTVQKMTVATNERLNIKAGANVALAFDDAGNAVTISTSGQLSGNVDTATRLQASRTIALSGDASGFVDFDGSANVTLPVNVLDDSHQHTFANLKSIPTTLAEHNITNAYTKAEVDSMVSGLDLKASVRVATTGNIALSGLQTVDGVGLAAGDRVLVKDQTAAPQNGIYAAASGAWARTEDANTNAEVTPGLYVFVEEGTVNDNSGWVLATNGPIALNSTALAFTQFNGLGQVTAGTGLQKTGNTLSLSDTGVAARTWGSGALIPTFEVDAQGRVKSVVEVAPVANWTTLQNKPSTRDTFGLSDVYTRTEVDNLVSGLDMKASVRLATTADLGALTGPKTVDGVAVATGDRVLVKDQATAVQNGIYIANTGTTWSRAGDADNSAKVTPGMYVFVEQGAVNDNSGWVLATNGAIALGSTALTFVQFNGLGQVTAGTGLQKSGNTVGLQNIVTAAGPVGNGTTVPVVTIDATGRVTALSSAAVSPPSWTSITGKPTLLNDYGITDAQPKSAELTAESGLNANGMIARTGAGARAVRTLAQGSGITVTNGDGVAGNPTIALATIGSATGPVGSNTTVPTVTIDAHGRVTALSSVAVTPSWTSIIGKPTLLNDYGITDAQPKSAELTAEAGLSGTGLIARTAAGQRAVRSLIPGAGISVTNGDGVNGNPTVALANVAGLGATQSFGSQTAVATFTVDQQGRITAAQSVAVAPPWTSVSGKPSSLGGYGITDAYTKAEVDAAIQGTLSAAKLFFMQG
jgi:phage-related tail fiber protein